jgi:hypothetical protein
LGGLECKVIVGEVDDGNELRAAVGAERRKHGVRSRA